MAANLHSPCKRKESKRQKDNGNKKHILGYAQPSLHSSHARIIHQRLSKVRPYSVACKRFVKLTGEDTSGWGGGGVACQCRVGHDSTQTLVGVLIRNLCATIIRSLDTNGRTSRSLSLANVVVSIDKDTGVGAVIADGKVVSLGCAGANKAVFVSHSSSCVAVEDTLVEVGSRFEEIIEEGGGGIHGDVRVGKAGSAVVVGGARDQGEKLESDQ